MKGPPTNFTKREHILLKQFLFKNNTDGGGLVASKKSSKWLDMYYGESLTPKMRILNPNIISRLEFY
jgi:hypothetical protein